MKKCLDCGKIKSLNNFTKRSRTRDGYEVRCRPCKSTKDKTYRESNKDRMKELWSGASKRYYDQNKDFIHLKKKYGMTPDEYHSMVASQGDKCRICRKKKKLFVDHCHDTGTVRGLLCQQCNSGIGFLGDDLDRLRAAVLYLEEFEDAGPAGEMESQTPHKG